MTSIDLQVKPQSGGLFLDVTLTQRCKASRLLVTLHCSGKDPRDSLDTLL
jgi:hypothetical protein